MISILNGGKQSFRRKQQPAAAAIYCQTLLYYVGIKYTWSPYTGIDFTF